MKWLSEHNAEISMKSIFCSVCKQIKSTLIMIEVEYACGKSFVWADFVDKKSRYSIQDYFKIAVKEIKTRYDLNS
jgi:hypothetical protein